MLHEPYAEEKQDRLPFDLRTVLLGVWRRKRFLAMCLAASMVLGVLGGIGLGTRVYESETVLLYKPVVETETDTTQSPTLLTQMNMVKLQANLEATRLRLSLPTTLEILGAACDVRVQRDTNLLIIKAQWENSQISSDIANTLRDAFLEAQKQIRKEQSGRQIADLQKRLQEVKAGLTEADRALQEFTTQHRVVDLDMETEWYLKQWTSLELLYQQGKIEEQTTHLQRQNLDQIMEDVQQRFLQQAWPTQDVGNSNQRIQRLLDSIDEDRKERANLALLEEKEANFKQADQLYSDGLISQMEYLTAKAELAKQKVLALDTDQIREWKTQVAQLDQASLPFGMRGAAMGEAFTQLQLKAFEIELDSLAVEEKVAGLGKALEEMRKRLDTLPVLQRQSLQLSREVKAREGELEMIAVLLAEARREYESESSDYLIVSQAQKPTMPVSSTRRLWTLAMAMLGATGTLAAVFLLEVIDTKVKSSAEVSLKMGLPVLGTLPQLSTDPPFLPTQEDSSLTELFRIMGENIRSAVPKKGARILLVSAKHSQGTTWITANLAHCLACQDERVIAVDAQIRRQFGHQSLTEMMLDARTLKSDLGSYLAGRHQELQELFQPTATARLRCLPCLDGKMSPGLLAADRMGALLQEASSHSSLVLMDGPPILDYVDAQLLARWADAIVLVVKSDTCAAAELQQAVSRLQVSGTPIIGVILNGIEPIYQDGHWRN